MYEQISEIMTLREACALLKVVKNTLLRLFHDKEIEGFMIGNRWKVPKESMVEFIRYR